MTSLIVTDEGKGYLKAQTPLLIIEVPSECPPSLISSPVHKKFLLIGICNHQTSAAPGGKHNAYKMRDLILDVYHYALSDITILINDGIEGRAKLTCENIVHPRKTTEQGPDTRHSTQLLNELSSSEEGDDEMMHHDRCLGPMLYDSLVQPLSYSSHLVAVLDMCHSGSLLGATFFLVCRNTQLMTKSIPQTNGPGFQKHNTPTSIAYAGAQRNMISPPSMSSLHLFRIGGSGPLHASALCTSSKGSLAQLCTLSLSIPSAAKTKDQDKNKEQLELSWILESLRKSCMWKLKLKFDKN
ncbi:hypothetical protein DFH08DRAFT_819270 [Mycena albidolilacea]|uniref:Uncharacterized protein n=1 Tax=Mycena albidolilacea TaxID=1033008 RepID=A0AAD6ZEL2_9AGAR|nr:hypothetical protein DFH08DRAFT_819270 [Mycena albidolilacea]